MGRTSKRVHAPDSAAAAVQRAGRQKQQGTKLYKAGVYARLSTDRDMKKNESAEMQIEIAEKYAEDWNRNHRDKIEIVGRYTDLGKTGTNFDRVAFKQLMQDVRLGEINCVIVKDLSRFGRNYLEAGNYIEKIFPFLGVRFIAVADGYDTGTNGGNAGQMASEIKNLVNDMYAKDFSARAKLSLRQRREEGAYVGGPPPYGYEAYQEGRVRKLCPDGNTAEIVRLIYELFVETENCQAVADWLNKRRINPPSAYRKSGEVYCPPGAEYRGWNRGAVERIIKSETYIGALVQGKTSLTARKEENRIRKPKEEWVKRENAHEPLIDLKLFEQAQNICRRIQERTNSHGHPTKGCPIEENIFDKVLYCGVCGRKMTRNSHVKEYVDGRRERREGYFCLNSIGTKREHGTLTNRISKTELTNILSVLFQTEFTTWLKQQKEYVEQGQALVRQKQQELEQKLRQTDRQLLALSEEEGEKYMAYRMGKLLQEEYGRCRLWKDQRLMELEKQKEQYQERAKNLKQRGEAYLKAVRIFFKPNPQKRLTKDLMEILIKKIYVYPGKRMEVVLTYGDVWTKEVK